MELTLRAVDELRAMVDRLPSRVRLLHKHFLARRVELAHAGNSTGADEVLEQRRGLTLALGQARVRLDDRAAIVEAEGNCLSGCSLRIVLKLRGSWQALDQI